MAGAIGTTTAPGTFLAPYVPSPESMVQRMLELARVGPGDTVYDLGAGDGRIVVAAAQRFGARAVGVELDDRRYAAAASRVRDLGLAARARIVHGDLAAVDVTPATVVTLYQLPAVNDLLRPALERQLRPGARVVTLDFPIDGWKPSRVVTAHLDDGSQHAVFLYDVGETSKESTAMATQDQTNRGYESGQARLELGGVSVGMLRSFEGGDASADVVTEKIGPDNIAHKHLAGVKYEDIAISFGAGVSNVLFDWMRQTLTGSATRKDGAVVLADYDGTERSRLNFYNGLISEIGFPACGGQSKEALYFTVKISPEYTAQTTGQSGTKASTSYGSKAAALLAPNFRLTIGTSVQAMVTAIDALVVTQQIVDLPFGELRDYQQEPGALNIPNLVITVADNSSTGLRSWFDDFVIKGNNTQDRTRSGMLEYQSSNGQNTLFTLTFSGLGIFKLARAKVEAKSESIQRLRAEMYCEQISFAPAASVSSSTSSGATQGTGTTGGATTDTGGTTGGTPVYVDPSSLASRSGVADKFLSAALAPNVPAVTAQRIGRPLRFRG